MWRQSFSRPRRNLDRNLALFVTGSLMLTMGLCLIIIFEPDTTVLGRLHLTLKHQLMGDRLLQLGGGDDGKVEKPNHRQIPKIIHYAFQSDLMPQLYLPTMNSCLTKNPDWSAWLWTESDVRRLLYWRWPGLLTLYENLGSQKERQLLAKFPILFSMGGVFLEPDMQCLRPLEAAVVKAGQAGAFVSEERPENHMILENSLFKLATGAMGASAWNEWFGFVIDTLLGRVRHNWEDLSLDDKFLTKCYQLWLDVKGGGSANGFPVALPWQYFSTALRDSETMARLCQQLKEWPSLAEVYTARQAACNSSWLTVTINNITSSRSIGVRQYSISEATQANIKFFNATKELGLNSLTSITQY